MAARCTTGPVAVRCPYAEVMDLGVGLAARLRVGPARWYLGFAPTEESLPGGATDALLRSVDPEAMVTVGERLVGTPLYLAPEALAAVTPQPSFALWGAGPSDWRRL